MSSPRYVGPFNIIKQINPVTYQLQLPPQYRICPFFHVSLLKPYRSPVCPSTESGPTEKEVDHHEVGVLRSGPWRLSRISQAQSPPNHNALLHLSINCTHLHIISTLISLHTKAHSSHQLILRFRFIRSGLMLLQQVTCLLTLITYLPPEERTHFAFSDTLQNGAMVTLRYGK